MAKQPNPTLDQVREANDVTALAQVNTTPMSIIAAMAERGSDPAQIEKMMDLQERWERNRAAEEFADALAEFQSMCPSIHKGRSGAHGAKFAGFDDIMAAIRPVLARCRLSVSFDTESTDGKSISCTCIVKRGIHEHRTKFTCPVATDLKANASQQYGSALSYVKRYAMCAALNIVVTDEDTDAGDLGGEPITQEQVKQLHDLLVQTESDTALFLEWAKVEQLADITQGAHYTKCLNAVKGKVK